MGVECKCESTFPIIGFLDSALPDFPMAGSFVIACTHPSPLSLQPPATPSLLISPQSPRSFVSAPGRSLVGSVGLRDSSAVSRAVNCTAQLPYLQDATAL